MAPRRCRVAAALLAVTSVAALEGALFYEGFESNSLGPFVKSKEGHYVDQPVSVVNHSLVLEQPAKHYALVAEFGSAVTAVEDAPLVFQYEVELTEGLTCGGAYVKLLEARSDVKAEAVTSESPYIVMFGPDKCGQTDKVHFILRWRNPVSGAWSEHHLSEPPATPGDRLPHLYTLVITPAGKYSIKIDGAVSRSGSLGEDFSPPIIPPTEISDPSDSKPSDWVDAAEIADPAATKPEDWDEEAPRHVPDDAAVMPEGWLEGEAANVADPTATLPEGWDAEEDGAWEAPQVPNPRCEVAPGCGPWVRPSKLNPAYKGPWRAPRIPNPEYKGPWAARIIPNPAYFEDGALGRLQGNALGAVAVEVWTMNGGITFRNFLLTRSEAVAETLGSVTWAPRHAAVIASQAAAERSAQEAEVVKAAATGDYLAQARLYATLMQAYLSQQASKQPLLASALAAVAVMLGAVVLYFGSYACCDAPHRGEPSAQPSSSAPKDAVLPQLTREQMEELAAKVLGGRGSAAAEPEGKEEEAPPASTTSSARKGRRGSTAAAKAAAALAAVSGSEVSESEDGGSNGPASEGGRSTGSRGASPSGKGLRKRAARG